MEFGELLKEMTLSLNAFHRRSIPGKGLTLSQCFLLSSIPDGGIDMSTLADKLGLDNSTVTRLVETQEKHGFVQREKYELDRRITRVGLTSQGEELAEKIEETLDTLGNAILESVPLEKREQVKESLELILWGLSKEKLKHS